LIGSTIIDVSWFSVKRKSAMMENSYNSVQSCIYTVINIIVMRLIKHFCMIYSCTYN